MMHFLCVSFCRSGAPSFFRRAREKIEVLEVMKIGENWEKLGNIEENSELGKIGWSWMKLEEKLGKIDENSGKLGKTGQNWAKLEKIEFRRNV